MSAHVPGCRYDSVLRRWTSRGEGCAAPEVHVWVDRAHLPPARTGPQTFDLSKPLGQHHTGGIFTPDGQGGGTLRWAEVVGWEPCDRDGRPVPETEARYRKPILQVHEVRKEAHRA